VPAAELRPFGELLGTLEIAGERLLADHVLADTQCFTHERWMQVVRRRDVHHVHGRISQRRKIGHRRGAAQRADHIDADAHEGFGVRLSGVTGTDDERPMCHLGNCRGSRAAESGRGRRRSVPSTPV